MWASKEETQRKIIMIYYFLIFSMGVLTDMGFNGRNTKEDNQNHKHRESNRKRRNTYPAILISSARDSFGSLLVRFPRKVFVSFAESKLDNV